MVKYMKGIRELYRVLVITSKYGMWLVDSNIEAERYIITRDSLEKILRLWHSFGMFDVSVEVDSLIEFVFNSFDDRFDTRLYIVALSENEGITIHAQSKF